MTRRDQGFLDFFGRLLLFLDHDTQRLRIFGFFHFLNTSTPLELKDFLIFWLRDLDLSLPRSVPNYYELLEEKVDFEAKNAIFQPRDYVHHVQEQILHDICQKNYW